MSQEEKPWFNHSQMIANFLAMAELKQAWLCSSGLTKTFHFMARFLAMAELK